jgi:hypothetical protein
LVITYVPVSMEVMSRFVVDRPRYQSIKREVDAERRFGTSRLPHVGKFELRSPSEKELVEKVLLLGTTADNYGYGTNYGGKCGGMLGWW